MSEMKKSLLSQKVREALNFGSAKTEQENTETKETALETETTSDLKETVEETVIEEVKNETESPEEINEETDENTKESEDLSEVQELETIENMIINSAEGSSEATELFDELSILENSNPFEEREKEIEQKLKEFEKYAKDGTVLLGEVFGVEPMKGSKNMLIAVLFNDVKVSIPDFEFFEPSYDFNEISPRYFALKEREQREVRERVAKFHIGAKIYFKVKSATRHKVEDPEYDGETKLIVIASRKDAMEERRDLFFLHIKNRTSPYNVKVGTVVNNACVLTVGENRVTVECCGVETRLDAYDLNNDNVENCRNVVSPGDRIPVRIKRIHINNDASVNLKVTGKITDSAKAMKTTVLKGTYLGIVERFNKTRGIYTVKINNGVNVRVPISFVDGNRDIFVGDRVQIRIVKLEDNFALGRARKI